MGEMFGMTFLGDPQILMHHQRNPFTGSMKDVPKEKFLKLFLEKGRFQKSEDAISRETLPHVFTDAVERQLNASEIDLMLRYFHFKPGNISYKEFEQAIDNMKAGRAEKPPPIIKKVAKSVKSPWQETANSEDVDIENRSKKDPLGPANESKRPMTTNMEYGWEAIVRPGQPSTSDSEKKPYFPKGGTDVTQAKEIQMKNANLIGERGGYHGRFALSRHVTSNQTSGFVDIHRRPSTAPALGSTGSRFLNHLHSNSRKDHTNRHCHAGGV